MWDLCVSTQYSYYCDFFYSGTASCLCERHHHGWVCYIDTTKITVLSLVWDRLVFTKYSYYRDFFCSGPASHLCNFHRHRWVHHIDTTKMTVWCLSSLLLSIDLRWFCYLIMFYFKLTNGTMMKWWMIKWCNCEINKRIGRFFSIKYLICSFVLFSNRTFSHQTKQCMISNFWSLTPSTATKFMFTNQATTEIRALSGVSRSLWGRSWL